MYKRQGYTLHIASSILTINPSSVIVPNPEINNATSLLNLDNNVYNPYAINGASIARFNRFTPRVLIPPSPRNACIIVKMCIRDRLNVVI